jgi:hypothetical protein
MPRLFAVTRSRVASDEDEIRSRLAEDCWTRNGLLRIRQILPWALRLGTPGSP